MQGYVLSSLKALGETVVWQMIFQLLLSQLDFVETALKGVS
jgi:hypothetical protein